MLLWLRPHVFDYVVYKFTKIFYKKIFNTIADQTAGLKIKLKCGLSYFYFFSHHLDLAGKKYGQNQIYYIFILAKFLVRFEKKLPFKIVSILGRKNIIPDFTLHPYNYTL